MPIWLARFICDFKLAFLPSVNHSVAESMFTIVITGKVGVQVGACVCTIVVGLILGLMNGKETLYSDEDDFLLEE